MAVSESMQAIVNQSAVQLATALMMTLRDADVGPQPASTAYAREPQR